jgi:hypothetical protein
MWVWFKNISDTFEARAARERTVRKLLSAAAKRGLPVGVGHFNPGECVVPQDCFVEELEAESLLIRVVIGQRIPAVLVRGSRVRISILTPEGFEQGEVTVLGEWDVQQNGIRRRGVRVSIPKALVHVQRRIHHRVTVAFDLSPRARLSVDPLGAPLASAAALDGLEPPREDGAETASDAPIVLGSGRVLDISESGARIRLTDLPESGPPTAGTIVRLAAEFPACFPSFECSAQIMHRVAAVRGEGWILGLRFLDGHPDLSRAIHQLEMRRAQRSAR